MSKNTIFIAIFGILPFFIFGQTLERKEFSILENGQKLDLALAGGMNLPQFSGVDLNHDGKEDLFIFDKDGESLSAFLHSTGTNYDFAPALLEHFPRLNKWALMTDYNQDGAPDIFAYTSELGVAGIEVHKGHWDNDKLAFEKLSFGENFDILYFEGPSSQINLYVSSIDIPAFSDIDGDGDLDILTFASAGGYVQYFRNFSQEEGYGNDTLIYRKTDACWGKFYESGESTEVTLSDDPNACAEYFHGGIDITDRHSGSTLLAMDLNNNGPKELFLGDVSFNNIVLLFNTGTPEKAFMTSQDTLFPAHHPVNIPTFPGIFSADINQDGHRDILSAPNADGISSSLNNAWLYLNKGAGANPQFEFIQEDFLVGKMLDLGTGAYPSFADINGDGLYDMLIGNESFFDISGLIDSRLMYYENIGSVHHPKFELKNDDYLGLKSESFNHWNFTPNFGDLDGDGDLDLLVGEYLGQLYYFENTAGADKPMIFAEPVFPFMDIDIGLVATPFMVDADEDGLIDILIGERNGNINFLKNIGNVGAPSFDSDHSNSPNNQFWGEVDIRAMSMVTGYSTPRMWKEDGIFRLFVGSQQGKIFEYTDIENNTEAFTKVTEDYGSLQDGGKLYPDFIDLDNDGFRELIIGNQRGGITAFSTELTQPVDNINLSLAVKKIILEPNPTSDFVKINFGNNFSNPTSGHLSIFNITGQLLLHKDILNKQTIDISAFSKGTYIVEVITSDVLYIGRLVAD